MISAVPRPFVDGHTGINIYLPVTGAAAFSAVTHRGCPKMESQRRWTAPPKMDAIDGLPSVSEDTRCQEYGRRHELTDGRRLTRREGLVQIPLKTIDYGCWQESMDFQGHLT